MSKGKPAKNTRNKHTGAQRERNASGLGEHRQFKKELRPPLAWLPTKPTSVQWTLDDLPEMFLIEAAVYSLTWRSAPDALHAVCDMLDDFLPSDAKDVIQGTITSLALVPVERRAEARQALQTLRFYDEIMPEAFLHALALYPESPAAWLVEEWKQTLNVDFEQGIDYFKGAVRRLWYGKGNYATRCRMVPVARMLKRGKIKFLADMPHIEDFELFPKYPNELTDDEQRLVEALSRTMFNAFRAVPAQKVEYLNWPSYFWRHSYELSPCVRLDPAFGGSEVSEAELGQTLEKLRVAMAGLRRAVDRAAQQAPLDIYDPDRDEVLFGLLSRQYRLFSALASDPWLWTVDLGTMFHRAMADSLILLAWYVRQNDPAQFRKFKEYSLGKQKLHKLHIQELVDQGREELLPVEERLGASINEEIFEELLTIDLGGNVAGQDMHKMAKEVDLDELYNLVFAPSSSALHAEWTGLKQFHLQNCGNPLHRFHRLPRLEGPGVMVVDVVAQAGDMLSQTLTAWVGAYVGLDLDEALSRFNEEMGKIIADFKGQGVK